MKKRMKYVIFVSIITASLMMITMSAYAWKLDWQEQGDSGGIKYFITCDSGKTSCIFWWKDINDYMPCASSDKFSTLDAAAKFVCGE